MESLLCGCFKSRSPKSSAITEPETIGEYTQVPATSTTGNSVNSSAEVQAVIGDRFPSLQLDLAVVSSMSIDPTPVMTAHGHGDVDDTDDPGGHTGANDLGLTKSVRSNLIRHLSLDSISKKRHSRLEIGRSEDEVARREELRRIRRQRIQNELSSEEVMGNDRASSIHSRSSADRPLLVLRGCPRDGLEFAIATHPEPQDCPSAGQALDPPLSRVIGICLEALSTDIDHSSEPRRNSCPDRFQENHGYPPSRKHSQTSLKSQHSAYTFCYPRPRILRQSRTPDMASMISWRMSHARRMERALDEDKLLGSHTPSIRSFASRSDLDTSIPEKNQEMESLSPLVEGGDNILPLDKLPLGTIAGRSKSTDGYVVPQSPIHHSSLTHSQITEPDDHTFNDASSSVYSLSPQRSPSTHTASKVDVRELKYSSSSIIRLALPTWSGSSLRRSKSSEDVHKPGQTRETNANMTSAGVVQKPQRVLRRSPKFHKDRMSGQSLEMTTEGDFVLSSHITSTPAKERGSSGLWKEEDSRRVSYDMEIPPAAIHMERVPVRSSSESFLNPNYQQGDGEGEAHCTRFLGKRVVSDLPPMPREAPTRDHRLQVKDSTTTLQFATPRSYMSSAGDTMSVGTFKDAQSMQSVHSTTSGGTVMKRSVSVVERRDWLEDYWSVGVKDARSEPELFKLFKNKTEGGMYMDTAVTHGRPGISEAGSWIV